MKLKYTCEYIHDKESNCYFGKIQELKGCMTQGSTRYECIKNLKEAKELWLIGALEDGVKIPEPNKQIDEITVVNYNANNIREYRYKSGSNKFHIDEDLYTVADYLIDDLEDYCISKDILQLKIKNNVVYKMDIIYDSDREDI